MAPDQRQHWQEPDRERLGAGEVLAQSDGVTVRAVSGGTSFFVTPDKVIGFPRFVLIKGRLDAIIDAATFTLLQVNSQNGTVVDLCAALQ